MTVRNEILMYRVYTRQHTHTQYVHYEAEFLSSA